MDARRLLVIDDEPALAKFVGEVAAECGYEWETTDDPVVARERVRSWQPSVVVLDLVMPKSDGIQLIRGLAEDHCGAHLIIMTGLDGRVLDAAKRMATELRLAIAGTLRKPMRAGDIRAILNRVADARPTIDAAALTSAIETRELTVEYQPIVKLETGEIHSVEALARWRHPVHGNIAPDVFIPMAEESGLIGGLTDLIYGQVLRQLRSWREDGIMVSVSVNLSTKSLTDTSLPERLHRQCEDVGIPVSAITFELTETATSADPTMAMEILTRLRVKGFDLSIDDFGTGYSSLQQLSRLPFSKMKIDKSFVLDMHENAQNNIIVQAIISLAHHLGLAAVAEGVESQDAVDMLRSYGCDFAQGYYFARPFPADGLVTHHRMWTGNAAAAFPTMVDVDADTAPIVKAGSKSRSLQGSVSARA
ncbi:MAG: EAL domain-containing response regulator [Rhodospirillaceae bacterium]|nr:EAL domain-containing response regulator [Rhodospirillaceae bacterium]